MADPSTCPPLTRESVQKAHERIKPYIHLTPVITSQTLNQIASLPQSERCPSTGPNLHSEPSPHPPNPPDKPSPSLSATPKFHLFFKCENQQKIGAFKARGAFHALDRLIQEEGLESLRKSGVCTHSSGNHAQALAFAARTHSIPAHIIMPSISTPSKIAGTLSHGAKVVFSGSTSEEREAVLAEVQAETGAKFVPPYDHPDVILGQGTQALELQDQVEEMLIVEPGLGRGRVGNGKGGGEGEGEGEGTGTGTGTRKGYGKLDAIICPVGGGGMCSGIATAMLGTGIKVFGAEPRFQGANDAERGLREGRRIERVKSLTIADGVRTPLGEIPWGVLSDRKKFAGVYSVSEEEIKAALKLLLERGKVFVEPTSAVGLAVVLYNEEFRKLVQREGGEEGWNVGVILSGGNTTTEALAKLFAAEERVEERAEGKVGVDGKKVAENVAG